MPELRRDPIVGRWVVMDTDHPKGPQDFPKADNAPVHQATCQFCPGKEAQTPSELEAVRPDKSLPNTPGWMVRAVPNKFPALTSLGEIEKVGVGIYDMTSGIGAHEVVIETPDHQKALADLTLEEMVAVIGQYRSRYHKLAQDSRFKYIFIFKNFGASAGATVEHAHSQIIALPMVPKSVVEELKGAEYYYQYRGRCVFCDIIGQEYQDRERIVSENHGFLAFCPFVPRYAFETWITPKAHSAEFVTMDEEGITNLASCLLDILRRMKKALSNPAYNFYVHTAPIDYARGESYHWHIEIIPKLTRSVGFEWGTGLHIVPTLPKDAARYLREAV